MTTFYRVDGGKLTFAEYWRMSPNAFVFLIAAGLKVVGIPLRFGFAVPRPDRLFLVEFGELPKAAQSGMKGLVQAAEAAGLRLAFCHRLAVPEPHRLGAAAFLLDAKNEAAVTVLFSKHGDTRESHLACVSRFADGLLASTTTIRKTMEPVPGYSVERYPGLDPAALLARHRGHVARLADEGRRLLPFDPDRLTDFVLEAEHRYVDFHSGRGVFVPMTDAELDRISRRGEA
jgi:hypothetical protein